MLLRFFGRAFMLLWSQCSDDEPDSEPEAGGMSAAAGTPSSGVGGIGASGRSGGVGGDAGAGTRRKLAERIESVALSQSMLTQEQRAEF